MPDDDGLFMTLGQERAIVKLDSVTLSSYLYISYRQDKTLDRIHLAYCTSHKGAIVCLKQLVCFSFLPLYRL